MSSNRTVRASRFAPVMLTVALLLSACGDGGGGDPAATGEPTATGDETEAAATGEPWRVGAPLGFTGALAAYSPSQRQGIELAVEHINESSPPAGREIEIIFEDTESEAENAITVFERLVRSENVHAIIGPTSSGEAFAADPVADEAGVPVIAPANTATGIPDIGECVFRVSAEEAVIIPAALVRAVDALDVESAAVIYASSDQFNADGGEAMVETLEEEGVEVTGTATIATGETAFQAQLTELLAADPEALGVATFTAEGIQIVRQARDLGFEGPIIGNKGFSGGGVISEVGETAGTIAVGAQWHEDAPTTGNAEFVAAYEERFDATPDEFAALAYDAVMFLAAGMEAAGADAEPQEVCTALQGVDAIDGVTGNLQFTDNGDVEVDGLALVSEEGQPFEVLE